jgi:hypothetical protein
VKGTFVPRALVGSAPREGFAVPERHHAWIRERSEQAVAALRASSYDIVGDLDVLLPALPREGRTPDQVRDEELLAAARVVLDRLGAPAPGTLDEALDVVADDLLARFSAG